MSFKFNPLGPDFSPVSDSGGGGITWSTPVDADIIPDGNNTRDLGASGSGFADLYINRVFDLDGGQVLNFTTGTELNSNEGDIGINSNASGIVNFGADRIRVFSAIGSSAGTLELRKIGGANYVAFQPQSTISTNTTYLWPNDGLSGQVLSTDGSGNLSWISALSNPLLNNVYLTGRNAADSADIDIVKVANDDGLILGGLTSDATYIGIYTKPLSSGFTASFDWITGDGSGTAGTGPVVLQTGDSSGTSGDTGTIDITTGSNTATSGNSGSASFSTGNSTNGNSGDINIGTGTAGGTRGALTLDARVIDLNANPFKDAVWENGVSASRPATPVVGHTYFDTSLGASGLPIWYDGTNWIDAAGNIQP